MDDYESQVTIRLPVLGTSTIDLVVRAQVLFSKLFISILEHFMLN
jgi:hypothetical protein